MNLFTKKLEVVLSDLELERKKRKPVMCKHNLEIQLNKSLQLLKSNITLLTKKIQPKESNYTIYISKIEDMILFLRTDLKNKIKIYEKTRTILIFNHIIEISQNISKLKSFLFEQTNKASYYRKIRINLFSLSKHIAKLSSKNDLIERLKRVNEFNHKMIDSISDILYQGSIENDVRLLGILDDTILLFENFENQDFLKLSVQFCLAKKYIKDIIKLKEILLMKYCNK